MHSARKAGLRRAVLTALVALSTVLVPRDARAVSVPEVRLDRMSAAELSDAEIVASNRKVASAYQALVAMWTDRFDRLGTRFIPPGLQAYRGDVRTSCGVMHANNAAYCATRNAIYFDEMFLAKLAGAASRELGTDGDMAAIGVIAHEMGHAVVVQLGEDSRIPYENEAAADCLAGVFTQQSARDGTLEAGDLDEAFFGLAAAGDPTPQLTGDRRLDDRIVTRASLMGHGTREQRLANFQAGYRRGAGACVSALAQ
ncbi:MAG: neutral zinc metallopeptidase [bacterium]